MPLPRRRLATAALCIAAALATAVSPVHAAGGGGTVRAAPSTVLVDCLRHDRVAPREYMLACGDGNNDLRGLKWSHWGARTAYGVGRQVANDCLPTCAGGRFHTFWVGVKAYRPVARKHGAHPYFSRLKVVYLDHRPTGAGPSETYTLP